MKRQVVHVMKRTTLAAAALGLGLAGVTTTSHAHPNHKWVFTTLQAKAQGQPLATKDSPPVVYIDKASAGPHVNIESPYPWPPSSYSTPLSLLEVKLGIAPYVGANLPVEVKVYHKWTGPQQGLDPVLTDCEDKPWKWKPYVDGAAQSGPVTGKARTTLEGVFTVKAGNPSSVLELRCENHTAGNFPVIMSAAPAKGVAFQWRRWTNGWKSQFGPEGSDGLSKQVPGAYFSQPGLYGLRARAAGLPNAKWTDWRDFCVGDPKKNCQKIHLYTDPATQSPITLPKR
ncbi:MAG: hypothetical protein HYZ03_03440 [candidate division NC10 bacterium]|nr:hypothetical protein [candidate division NC10 bacterium]